MLKEAIILAGGLGTRLQGVIADIPKPMAPIKGEPFLTFLLETLKKYNFEKVILAVGYKHEYIQNYYKNNYKGMLLEYALEKKPLGTGGGILNALKLTKDNEVLLLNGDTYFDVDIDALYAHHQLSGADLTLSLKEMKHFERYGSVVLEDSQIVAFREKMKIEKGYINGGVYVLNASIFTQQSFPEIFSFESDFMEAFVNEYHMQGFISDGYFIDMGIPEDYEKAQHDLPALR